MQHEPNRVGLVVAADEPALFFSTIKAAEAYLEAIDVHAGVYPIAYDPEARSYTLRAEGLDALSPGKVRIELLSEERDPKAFRLLLLKALAHDEHVNQAWDTAELLRRAGDHLTA